jgi:integrase
LIILWVDERAESLAGRGHDQYRRLGLRELVWCSRRGRNASGRADTCWLPIAPGLTPHGLRHKRKTLTEKLGTSPTLMDERMGHEDSPVQARYSHVTPEMRRRLMQGLTEQRQEALDARRALSPGSSVAALDALLFKP